MLISLRTRTVRANRMEVHRGRPSGHTRRGLGAIRAVCHAWRTLKVGFDGSGLDDFPDFLVDVLFCTRYSPFFEMFVLFAHAYLYKNDTECPNSGFPVQGQVTLSFKYGCSACRVSRVHV